MTFFSNTSLARSRALIFCAGFASACGSAGVDTAASGTGSSNGASQGATDEELDELYGDGGPFLTVDATSGAAGAHGDSTACLRLASFGTVSRLGAVSGDSGPNAIVSWLNQSSNVEAEHYPDIPELTEEFLNSFDVILLQDISAWQLAPEDADIFEYWVRGGGAVFSLAGYSTDPTEVLSRNELLSFSGMAYANFSSGGDTALKLGECSYCLGTTYRQEGWDSEHAIASGIEAVGAYQGRSIQGDGEVVASDEGLVLAMAKKVDSGRVFLFHDEWVSYPSQWAGEPVMACSDNPECAEVAPQTSYQVPRFWYNSLKWLSGNKECFELSL